MFAGHFAVGMAAKKISPRTGLPVLIAAATFLDIVWPPLILLGIEYVSIDPGSTAVSPLDFTYYPYSHSLLAAVFWSILFGTIYLHLTHDKKGATVVGLLVTSHWFLDFITHAPDLPLAPGIGRYFGLGLWNSLSGTAVLELGMFFGAMWLYVKDTRSDTLGGKIALWSFICVILSIQLMSYTGNPPPSVEVIGWVGIVSALLFIGWAWIIEKSRYISR